MIGVGLSPLPVTVSLFSACATVIDDDRLVRRDLAFDDLGPAAVGRADHDRHRRPARRRAGPRSCGSGRVSSGLLGGRNVAAGGCGNRRLQQTRALLVSGHRGRGREPQRRIRHQQRVLDLLHDDLGGRRHAGPDQQFGIVDRQHRLVGDDALHDLGAEADVADAGGKLAVRIGIDAERRLLTDPDLADIGLVDVDLQFHVAQVLGDHEQDRRLQRRGDDLTGIDAALQDDAVDRRADAGLGEVDLVEPQIGFDHLDLGERAGVLRNRPVIGRLGSSRSLMVEAPLVSNSFLRSYSARFSSIVAAVSATLARAASSLARNAVDRGLELVGVELGERLADLHRAVVVDMNLADGAGQLARYVDLRDRLRGAGRRDDDGQVAANGRFGDVARSGLIVPQRPYRIDSRRSQPQRARPTRYCAAGKCATVRSCRHPRSHQRRRTWNRRGMAQAWT